MTKTTETKIEANAFVSADANNVEVTVWKRTITKDGRNAIVNRENEKIAQFTCSPREAAQIAADINDGIAYAFTKLAEGVPESEW